MFYVDCTGFYGSGSHEKPEFPELSDLLKEMDRLGIWASVVSNAQARDGNANYGNHRLMEDIEKTPGAGDRIIPAFVVSPKCICESGTMEYTKEMLASGRVGALSVYPVTGRFELGHLERVFDELCEYSPVVLVDCGLTAEGRQRAELLTARYGAVLVTPQQLAELYTKER